MLSFQLHVKNEASKARQVVGKRGKEVPESSGRCAQLVQQLGCIFGKRAATG